MVCTFFVYRYGDHRNLHSFPTRRSSDLARPISSSTERGSRWMERPGPCCFSTIRQRKLRARPMSSSGTARMAPTRSEEHTSELQSRRDLVCRLLLEKKKASDSVGAHNAM